MNLTPEQRRYVERLELAHTSIDFFELCRDIARQNAPEPLDPAVQKRIDILEWQMKREQENVAYLQREGPESPS